MRAIHATPLALSVLSCATLCPSAVSGHQLSARLQRCIPTATSEHEVLDVSVQGRVPVIVVDHVVFDGVTQMPATERANLAKRLKAMRVKADDEGLQEQQGVIENWWKDHGYFRAELRINALPTALEAGQQHVSLTIHANEGDQYRLGSVKFRSSEPSEPLVFPESQLRQMVQLQPGDIFAAESIRRTLEALKQLYASRGYIDFVATPITEIDEATHHRIDMIMELDQQMQFRIGRVEVLTSNPVVRAAVDAQIKTGEVFDITTLRYVLKQNASLLPANISEQDVNFDRDLARATVDLRFNLEPCPQAPTQ
jgi:hypothetical protein